VFRIRRFLGPRIRIRQFLHDPDSDPDPGLLCLKRQLKVKNDYTIYGSFKIISKNSLKNINFSNTEHLIFNTALNLKRPYYVLGRIRNRIRIHDFGERIRGSGSVPNLTDPVHWYRYLYNYSCYLLYKYSRL
jgi:hypothetical protein